MARFGVLRTLTNQHQQYSNPRYPSTPGNSRLVNHMFGVLINRTVKPMIEYDRWVYQMLGRKPYGYHVRSRRYADRLIEYGYIIDDKILFTYTHTLNYRQLLYRRNNSQLTLHVEGETIFSYTHPALALELKAFPQNAYIAIRRLDTEITLVTTPVDFTLPEGDMFMQMRVILEHFNYFKDYIPDWLDEI